MDYVFDPRTENSLNLVLICIDHQYIYMYKELSKVSVSPWLEKKLVSKNYLFIVVFFAKHHINVDTNISDAPILIPVKTCIQPFPFEHF